MEKQTEYPFKASHGTFSLSDGSKVKYTIKTDGTEAEPVSLEFKALNKDGSPKRSDESDSTLYFDAHGNITSRAPLNTSTNVLKLKAAYAAGLLNFLGADAEEYPYIRGFFEAGEKGIQRETAYTAGKIRKIMRNEAL